MPRSRLPSQKRTCACKRAAWLACCAETIAQRLRRLPQAEEGTIAQLSLLAMMACVIAVGLVGNVARVTHEKVKTQNAADATAHAAAQWHARSLNAVTATNHLMGELTAICVLHEAIGGPELDLNDSYFPGELQEADKEIENTQTSLVASNALGFDATLVDYVKRELDKDGETRVGGSLYDARLALKQWVRFMFIIKRVAYILEQIPYTKPVGIALGAAASGVLIKCMVEWNMLKALEGAARTLIDSKQMVQDQLLRLLNDYQTQIANDDPVARTGPIEEAIERTIKRLDQANGARSIAFRQKLPLQKEDEPLRNGKAESLDSNSVPTESISAIRELDAVYDSIEKVADIVDKIADLIGIDRIEGFPSFTVTPPRSEPESYPDNPTTKKYEALEADWEVETKTQWTRATFPWVHSGRSKLIGFFNQEPILTFSRMPTFYGHWTNRLAVAKSYECRSGERMGRAPHDAIYAMHVLVRQNDEEKYNQGWRQKEGSREAEQYFTVAGFSERPVEPLFSPSVFGSSKYDQFCAAQAIFYNANRPDDAGGGDRQPMIAWDTLNWRTGQSVVEYSVKPRQTRGDISDLLNVFRGESFDDPPEIKLNWQAKLVPLTKPRLKDALQSDQLSGDMRDAMEKMSRYLSRINTH